MALGQENQLLKQQVARLQQQVNTLQAEVEKLREQVNKNSQNSSKPPSSDTPQKRTYPKPEPSGRKKRRQKGHAWKRAEAQASLAGKSGGRQQAGGLWDLWDPALGEDPQPVRHQVSELPRVEPEVVEYQLHTLTCCACGGQTTAEWPVDMPKGSFGERLQATVAYLGGRFGISHRDIARSAGNDFSR